MAPFRDKALKRFDDATPSLSQDSPHPHMPPNYGTCVQMTDTDTSAPVDKTQQKYLQQVLGTLLWYRRGVDSSILTALSTLALQQMQLITNTMMRLKQLLDYIASQDPAVITYCKSDMIYSIHSDAGYLNKANAHSRAKGYHFLSENQPFPPNNGAILTVSEIIKAVMSSTAETELGALYINA